ncbi:MAG: hypothetical protein F6J94_20645 [Moorea sp. SIO1F2]|uniref:hypothetical protein n=1 Tax=Moorena sp. SIO1F2 TaxID=2607819 RepID=UPI0013B68254|nr:hypothetical protein [Moorena sp. SIO1F2]NET84234.1 hypothetical protein [Moorena sp. SIO1F2]
MRYKVLAFREQGAGSREQGAGSREQRIWEVGSRKWRNNVYLIVMQTAVSNAISNAENLYVPD